MDIQEINHKLRNISDEIHEMNVSITRTENQLNDYQYESTRNHQIYQEIIEYWKDCDISEKIQYNYDQSIDLEKRALEKLEDEKEKLIQRKRVLLDQEDELLHQRRKLSLMEESNYGS